MVRLAAAFHAAASHRTTSAVPRSLASHRVAALTGPIIVEVRSSINVRIYHTIQGALPYKKAEWIIGPSAVDEFGHPVASSCWSVQGLVIHDLHDSALEYELSTIGSVFEYALDIGYSSQAYTGATDDDYDFYGGDHVHETRTAFSLTLDGVPIDPSTAPAGLTLAGSLAVLTQAMTITKPAGIDMGDSIGTGTLVHTWGEYTSGLFDLHVQHSHTIDLATYTGAKELSYRSAYGAMMPANKSAFDRAQAGSQSPIMIVGGNVIGTSGNTDATCLLYHSNPAINPWRMKMILPNGGPELTDQWTYSAPSYLWFYDLDAYSKWYATWIGDTKTPVPRSPTVHETRYQVLYAP